MMNLEIVNITKIPNTEEGVRYMEYRKKECDRHIITYQMEETPDYILFTTTNYARMSWSGQ